MLNKMYWEKIELGNNPLLFMKHYKNIASYSIAINYCVGINFRKSAGYFLLHFLKRKYSFTKIIPSKNVYYNYVYMVNAENT
jgi:hypothetical protein